MNRLFSGRSDMPFALLPSRAQLITAGRSGGVGRCCRISKSVFTSAAQSQHQSQRLLGVSNYVRILSDPGFWHSLWMTVWYTTLVVAGSTVLGLAVAMFFEPRVPPAQNRAFAGAPLSLRNAVYFAGVRLEIHVQQRLRHCELPRRRSSASL